jgi:hypothetical protein
MLQIALATFRCSGPACLESGHEQPRLASGATWIRGGLEVTHWTTSTVPPIARTVAMLITGSWRARPVTGSITPFVGADP